MEILSQNDTFMSKAPPEEGQTAEILLTVKEVVETTTTTWLVSYLVRFPASAPAPVRLGTPSPGSR